MRNVESASCRLRVVVVGSNPTLTATFKPNRIKYLADLVAAPVPDFGPEYSLAAFV